MEYLYSMSSRIVSVAGAFYPMDVGVLKQYILFLKGFKLGNRGWPGRAWKEGFFGGPTRAFLDLVSQQRPADYSFLPGWDYYRAKTSKALFKEYVGKNSPLKKTFLRGRG